METTRPALSRALSMRGGHLRAVCTVSWLCSGLLGCGSDLGECNSASANELVYNRSGQVATKGQALAHDTCGNGAFCHSSAAKGTNRYGAPAKLDFDMLPRPTGLARMRDFAEDSWGLTKDGQMPPSGVGRMVIGNNDWLADIRRGTDALPLPALGTVKGMAIFRNWLACGAPVVQETQVPPGLQPMQDGFVMAGSTPAFSEVHAQILKPYCATAGCHTSSAPAGGLALEDACSASIALFKAGACGKVSVVAGDADGSFLIDKIEAATPSCGGAMPPSGPLPKTMRDAVRAWITAGAEVDACP